MNLNLTKLVAEIVQTLPGQPESLKKCLEDAERNALMNFQNFGNSQLPPKFETLDSKKQIITDLVS